MKRCFLIVLLALASHCFFPAITRATDHSDPKSISSEEFLHYFDSTTLVHCNNIENTLYCHTDLQLIGGKYVTIEHCVTLKELRDTSSKKRTTLIQTKGCLSQFESVEAP